MTSLTRTAGVYTNNSHSGSAPAQPRGPLGIGFKLFLFTLLRTLLHSSRTQPFYF
jgi:hypothetical protein